MKKIGAVVLAAGLSSRMKKPKMLLPWGKKTVIESVVGNLIACRLDKIILVTGQYHEEFSKMFRSTNIDLVFNPDYANGEMLVSFQIGLRELSNMDAGLLSLGDQPQIQPDIIQRIINEYSGQKILIPSYNMRRGHPWMLDKSIWSEILSLRPPATLRDFMMKNRNLISYVEVNNPAILQDMDTPDDYENLLKIS